ncbi:MAG: aminodeoxychorismate/anthranilate synthase component II [Eubacteriales bacterium]|nr:aminodeoxychorismate/anthranilate synthase component II [Eubacteriales bacterium]
MILLIDNYDSFSYNLYQMIGEIQPDIKVIRNGEYTVSDVLKRKPERIILSPGPGRPAEAGICEALIREIADKQIEIPLLGVCLGHQGICEALGGTVSLAHELMHGKKDMIQITAPCRLFAGLPGEIEAARYHSLIVEEKDLPKELEVTAVSKEGEVMAVQHRNLPVFGLQFHPESILTPRGKDILQNFMNI